MEIDSDDGNRINQHLYQENEHLSSMIIEQNAEIKDLQSKIAHLQKKVDCYESSLRNYEILDEELVKLKDLKDALINEIDGYRHQIESLNELVELLETQCTTCGEELQHTQDLLLSERRRLERLQKDYDLALLSLSMESNEAEDLESEESTENIVEIEQETAENNDAKDEEIQRLRGRVDELVKSVLYERARYEDLELQLSNLIRDNSILERDRWHVMLKQDYLTMLVTSDKAVQCKLDEVEKGQGKHETSSHKTKQCELGKGYKLLITCECAEGPLNNAEKNHAQCDFVNMTNPLVISLPCQHAKPSRITPLHMKPREQKTAAATALKYNRQATKAVPLLPKFNNASYVNLADRFPNLKDLPATERGYYATTSYAYLPSVRAYTGSLMTAVTALTAIIVTILKLKFR